MWPIEVSALEYKMAVFGVCCNKDGNEVTGYNWNNIQHYFNSSAVIMQLIISLVTMNQSSRLCINKPYNMKPENKLGTTKFRKMVKMVNYYNANRI